MKRTRHAQLILVGAALAFIFACDEVTYDLPELPPGAAGKTDEPVFAGDGRLIDARADSDGDGIPDGEEIDGWTVTVDANGFAVGTIGSGGDEALEVREVTSDPRYADTDGDGLGDGEERQVKADPRRIDTDGDTLGDAEEVSRWGTSPSSADTDGDARGGDPDNPRPPVFALFDAAELRLFKDPVNPDAPLIPGAGATSPSHADTDGDGVNDYDEVLGGKRRATFAEVPKLKILPTPGADLDMYFNLQRTDGTSETTSHGTTLSFEESGSVSFGTSTNIAFESSQYVGAYIKSLDSAGCCLTVGKSENEVGLIYKSDVRVEQSVSFNSSIEGAFNASQAKNEAESFERSNEVSFSSGTIALALDAENTGPVPYRMQDLVLSIQRLDRYSRLFVPVTEIAGDDMSLAPGERRTLDLVTHDVPVQAMRDLLADPALLQFEPSRFSLVDQYGLDFDFRMSDVTANCATITVDYGDRSDRFYIAANIDKDGVSLGMAMSQAGIDYAAEPVDRDGIAGAEAWAVTINGRTTEFHEGVAASLDDRYPYPPDYEPGSRKIKRGWFGAIRQVGTTEDAPYVANLFDTRVHAGDEVFLVYSEDLDRDGVSALDEGRYGSSDATPHSDADGLSDYWETRVGWKVETAMRAPYRVLPSPASADTDGDGLRDDEEAAVPTTDFGTGMDPWLPDTDFDGLSDRFEYDDTAYGLDPNRPTDLASLPQPTASCRIEAAERPTGLEAWRYRVVAEGTDPQSDLVELEVQYGADVFALYQREPTERIAMYNDLEVCFSNPALVAVTAKDELGMEATVPCAWAEGAPHDSDPCNGVDDDCDGVTDDGCPAAGQDLTIDHVAYNWPWVGSSSATFGELACAGQGGMLSAIVTWSGEFVDRVGAVCNTGRLSNPRKVEGREEYVYDVVLAGRNPLFQTFGGHDADEGGSTELNCQDRQNDAVVAGIFGRAGGLVDRLGAICMSMTVERIDGTWQLVTHYVGDTTSVGGGGGDEFRRDCPAGTVASKLATNSGTYVDNLSGDCSVYHIPMTPVVATELPTPR